MSANWSRSDLSALVLIGGAQFLVAFDFTTVYVALPSIAAHFQVTQVELQWVVTSYAVAFGGPLLIAGRLVDRIGGRSVFVLGHLLTSVSCVLAALSPVIFSLITARVLEGLGAALLAPATLALLKATFTQKDQRNRAIGIWGAAGAVGGALGLVSGGLLVEYFGWSSVFSVIVPLSLASAALATRWFGANTGQQDDGGKYNLGSGLIITAAVALLIAGLSTGVQQGWNSVVAISSMLASASAFGLFFRGRVRNFDQLIPRTLLQSRGLVWAMTVAFTFHLSLNNQMYLLMRLLQDALNYSPVIAGVIFLPNCLAIAGGARMGVTISRERGPKIAVVFGMLAGGFGALLCACGGGSRTGLAILIIGLVVGGVGQGVVWSGFWSVATDGVPEAFRGTVSAMVTMVNQFGQAIGMTLLAVVLSVAWKPSGVGGEFAYLDRGLRICLCGIGIMALACSLASGVLSRRRVLS